MDLLKRMIEGYDEQNRLVLQEDVAGIETHGETPCAVVYLGSVKGLIPVYEFGIEQGNCVKSKEDLLDGEKLKNSYQFLRNMTGQKIAFMVKGHHKKDNVFMASRKEGIEWMRKRTEEKLAVGDKILAVVRKVLPKRIIADIGGMTAFLLAQEYQHGWSEDLTEFAQPGDHIMVKYLGFDKEKGVATISRKALIPDYFNDSWGLTGPRMGRARNQCLFLPLRF